jgi:hypothetical protein
MIACEAFIYTTMYIFTHNSMLLSFTLRGFLVLELGDGPPDEVDRNRFVLMLLLASGAAHGYWSFFYPVAYSY